MGQRFLDWLEAKLVEAGVSKVVPNRQTLEMAWRHAHRRAQINYAMQAAFEEVAETASNGRVPPGLVTRVTKALEADPSLAWDDVIVRMVKESR